MSYDPAVASLEGDVVFFPVRHHSPAAARLAEEAIMRLRPQAVLIEGPSDYNPHWPELLRDHALPIAIYSYAAFEGGIRSGAFYPFCVYSPEWHAIRVAARENTPAEFIDLPWIETCLNPERRGSHAYADGEERHADYMLALAQNIGLDNFDDLWDYLFEVNGSLTLESYMKTAHELMYYSRASAPELQIDLRREAFMAARIAARRGAGKLLVITGGYHCWGLFQRLNSAPVPQEETSAAPNCIERGISLTPYSYERLDALTGYDAGMPNPGFYHHAWLNRETSFQTLLREVIRGVRDRKQTMSTADVIAVEALARGLAELRGQPVPWRRELMDGVRGALIKDDLIRGHHPMLEAVAAALRGSERGRLAEGSKLPPLVGDIQRVIAEHELAAARIPRELQVNLTRTEGLTKARILHRLRGLEIHGYTLKHGGQLSKRDDVTQVIEQWTLHWSEEFEAACIERSVYGPTLEDASRSKLEELAKQTPGLNAASHAASLLLEAGLQGHAALASTFETLLARSIREDSDFSSVCAALNTLLYLHRYDDVLGKTGNAGVLLTEAYHRALWLLEAMVNTSDPPPGLEQGIALLRETLLRSGAELALVQDEFTGVFHRLVDHAIAPFLRGAAAGVLWSMLFLGGEQIALPPIADPQALGDFLNGLFRLARETVQRNPDLVKRIDSLVMLFHDDGFLEALPSLRLAFSVFTPREKHHIVETLLGTKPAPKLSVTVEEAARAYAWESWLFREAERHGVLK